MPGFIYTVFLVPSCTTAFLFLQMFSLQKKEKHGHSAGLEDKIWRMLLNTLPRGAGSTGQPQHGAAVDIQTSYTMGGNYRIASRNPHISYFFSTDRKRDTFREIFFFFFCLVLLIMEAGAGEESHDFWQGLQQVMWKKRRVCDRARLLHLLSTYHGQKRMVEGVALQAPPWAHPTYLYQLQPDASHGHRCPNAPASFVGCYFQAGWKGQEIEIEQQRERAWWKEGELETERR